MIKDVETHREQQEKIDGAATKLRAIAKGNQTRSDIESHTMEQVQTQIEEGDEVGIRELRKDLGFQDLIGWTAGMGGCREDIGIPAVHGGRVFLVQ